MQTPYTTSTALKIPTHLGCILPTQLQTAILQCGAPSIEEMRLHSDRFATVTSRGKNYFTQTVMSSLELQELLQKMCKHSLYAYAENINQGYLTLADGIRVGICGTAAIKNGQVIGVNDVTGLIIRIPHVMSVNSTPVTDCLYRLQGLGGVLIYAPPGIGKTTLLRAVIAEISSPFYGWRTVVVDTRRELGYSLSDKSLLINLLVGYPRQIGIEIAVRSLGARLVVCDEIGNPEESTAILAAANSGVPLLASAHAASLSELLRRPAIRELHRAGIFGAYVGIERAEHGFRYHFFNHHQATASIEEQTK